MKKISKALEKFQKENQYTYQKTAEVLHMSKSSVYAYIHHLRNPTLKSIQKLAKALDTTVSSLLDDTVENEREKLFLKILKQESALYEYLLENTEERIQLIKQFVLKNNNDFENEEYT